MKGYNEGSLNVVTELHFIAFYNPSFNSTLHYTCVDTRAVNTLVIHYLRNHAFEGIAATDPLMGTTPPRVSKGTILKHPLFDF